MNGCFLAVFLVALILGSLATIGGLTLGIIGTVTYPTEVRDLDVWAIYLSIILSTNKYTRNRERLPVL